MTGASGGRRGAPRRKVPLRLAEGVVGAVLLAAPALAAEPTAGEGSGFLGRLFDRVGRVWVVDAPGAAGARFSLGASSFFEHHESLRFTDQETTVTSTAPASQPVVTTVVADPELLGRKFDITWELIGAGVEVPVALPALGGAVYPTLVLQAGGADFDLEFGDRSRPEDSASLTGRGAFYGVGADLAAPLCAGCSWLAFAGFRYQWLPESEVDRGVPIELTPSPGDPGAARSLFVPLVDETRLRREAREISGRLAYGLPGARVLPFAGVRHRRSDVTIDDELVFQDSLGPRKTRLESRTRLESETTLALAGFDFQLGPRLFGSFETSAGEDDYGAALRVVALLQGPGVPPPPPPGGQTRQARELAGALAPRLAEIEAAFLAGRAALTPTVGPNGEPAFFAAEVEALFTTTEADLLAALAAYPELEALGDWARDRFAEARAALAASGPARAFHGTTHLVLAALQDPRPRPAQETGRTVPRSRADAGLDVAEAAVVKLSYLASRRLLQVRIAFSPDTEELGEGATLFVYPRFNRSKGMLLGAYAYDDCPPTQEQPIFRGSYSFEVRSVAGARACNAARPGDLNSVPPCPLDLVNDLPPVIACEKVGCYREDCP